MKTELRKKNFAYLESSRQFSEYFPESVVLDDDGMNQLLIGLKIYDPKMMDSWFLRIFIEGRECSLDLLVRDRSSQQGVELLKTMSLILTTE